MLVADWAGHTEDERQKTKDKKTVIIIVFLSLKNLCFIGETIAKRIRKGQHSLIKK